MTTENQLEANRENSLLSTGPKTEGGKAIVSQNAVKHGIFTSELIIEHGDGKENREDYEDLLQNLCTYFDPQGQLEETLVEKIAVDFWRLKRLIRFETGSIRQFLDNAIQDYLNEKAWEGTPRHRTEANIEEEKEELKVELDWNIRYLDCLKRGVVDVSNEIWEGKDIESELLEDYYQIIRGSSLKEKLKGLDIEAFETDELNFQELRNVLQTNGFDDKAITALIIKNYEERNGVLKAGIKIKDEEREKIAYRNELQKRLTVLPPDVEIDKILRYERSIEKAIFQKIVILKSLQRPVVG